MGDAARDEVREALARKVPKASVVSAFSTVPSEVLFEVIRREATDSPPAEPHVLW
jgi:predicted dinucleotide-binding enzyme